MPKQRRELENVEKSDCQYRPRQQSTKGNEALVQVFWTVGFRQRQD